MKTNECELLHEVVSRREPGLLARPNACGLALETLIDRVGRM